MALAEYNEIFQITKKKLYVAICIYRRMENVESSQINHMLADIIDELKQEVDQYENIEISYIYETEGLMEMRKVNTLSETSKSMFTESGNISKSHNLNHVFYMGMAVLAKNRKKKENAEFRQYLVTDERFTRTDKLIWKNNDKETLNPAFEDFCVTINLYKSKDAGDETFERFICRNKKGKVIIY